MTKSTEGFGHLENENVQYAATHVGGHYFYEEEANNLYKFDVKISWEDKKRC